jgi:CheY-like chemotaxis protein
MNGYVLVVDDDADHRDLLTEALHGMGYEAAQAENGKVALDILAERLPALVLLDLKMPIMSGWAVLEALQQMPHASSIPVLVISAYGFEWEAELVGAAGHIKKPVELEVFRRQVSRLLGAAKPRVLH